MTRSTNATCKSTPFPFLFWSSLTLVFIIAYQGRREGSENWCVCVSVNAHWVAGDGGHLLLTQWQESRIGLTMWMSCVTAKLHGAQAKCNTSVVACLQQSTSIIVNWSCYTTGATHTRGVSWLFSYFLWLVYFFLSMCDYVNLQTGIKKIHRTV